MIGIVAGSFDPITNGHVWLIKRALRITGKSGMLYVVVGVNPDKKYYFSAEERIRQIQMVLNDEIPEKLFDCPLEIQSITNELLINHARNVKADCIFRGIRNIQDFAYETDIQKVNRKICPTIETVFFVPPPKFVEVSSSTIKGIVGFNNWHTAISDYVHPFIISEFERKLLDRDTNEQPKI
jgi:pantetheine-phosphate adenylyltransferase